MAAITPVTFRRPAPRTPAGKRLRVLVVDGNAADAHSLYSLAADPALGFELTFAESLRQALAHAHDAACDAMLVDVSLPDSAGLNTVQDLSLAFPRAPIVVMTGLDDEETALQALRSGAQDYLLRGSSDARLVGRAIRYAIARKAYEGVLAERANFDSLTGLVNRGLLHDRLDHALARASRSRKCAAVMFIDLDGFKRVNDTLGHDIGDEVLKAVAGLLSRIARKAETVARLGGDEFVVVLEAIEDVSEASAVAARILHALEAPLPIRIKDTRVSCSIGIAIFPGDGADTATLLRQADAAMFNAKRRGPNNVQISRSP